MVAGTVRPFFVPPLGSVRAQDWMYEGPGSIAMPLPDHLSDWNQQSVIRLHCSVGADHAEVLSHAGLDSDSDLIWFANWKGKETGLVGHGISAAFGDALTLLELEIAADDACNTLIITRSLLYTGQSVVRNAGAARIPGSVLWSDSTDVRLTGEGSAFPVVIVDFAAVGRTASASWFLEIDPNPKAAAMGGLQLMVNSRDVLLVESITATARTTEQELIVFTLYEGVIAEFVRWALERWDELGSDLEEDSTGAAARLLTERVLPDPLAWVGLREGSMELNEAIAAGSRDIGFGRLFL